MVYDRSTPVNAAARGTSHRARGGRTLDPAAALLDPAARWALAVALPSCRYDLEDDPAADDHTGEPAWLSDPLSGSWATIATTADQPDYLVQQAGPRRLWDEAHAAYAWWQHAGKPTIDDWEWIITPDRQTIAPTAQPLKQPRDE